MFVPDWALEQPKLSLSSDVVSLTQFLSFNFDILFSLGAECPDICVVCQEHTGTFQ